MKNPRSRTDGAGRAKISLMAGMVVLMGFALRLYSFFITPVINPDGTLYIQQAKALHFGLWDQVLACYPYLSSYPLFIAVDYSFFGDWVISAKVVSLVFGTATLIPLYLLLRRFLDQMVSVLALLVFAVSPPFVELSREVIRDPVFWFFAVLGLYLFVRHMESGSWIHLLLASVSFLAGVWARTEGLVFILAAPFFLLFSGPEKRWRRIGTFVIPPVLVTFAAGTLLWSLDFHVGDLFAAKKISAFVSGPVKNYEGLRETLETMKENPPAGLKPYFLDKVRNLVWLVALGSLVVEMVRAFFLPFFLVFVVGLAGIVKKIRGDTRLRFLAVMSVCSLPVLYIQVIHSWAMFTRFIAVFLFPAFVVVGFGIQRILNSFTDRMGLRVSAACYALLILILLAAVPKNLLSHDRSGKVVFKEVGEYIGDQKGDHGPVSIGAGFKEVRLVHFYAHVEDRAAPCFQNGVLHKRGRKNIFSSASPDVDYYIWDEKTGTADQLEKLRGNAAKGVKELGEWQSPKLGRMILFKVGS